METPNGTLTPIEKAAIEAHEGLEESGEGLSFYDIFKAGADWQKEQFEKERLAHCDELTPEQAQIESDFVVNHLKEHNRTPTFIDAIEYGMKWQKEQMMTALLDMEKDSVEVERKYGEGGRELYLKMLGILRPFEED